MKQFVETDFDKVYDELSRPNEDGYSDYLYKYIKNYSIEEREAINNPALHVITENNIHMALPNIVKTKYCKALNDIAAENGGWLSLAYYFDTRVKKLDRASLSIVCQDHHINFRELCPEEENDPYNQIIITTEQHINLHKVLADACEDYIKTTQEISKNELRTIRVCTGAYKEILRKSKKDASYKELSTTMRGAKAGKVHNHTSNFNDDTLNAAKSSDYIQSIHGSIPNKEIYLFKGFPAVPNYFKDLTMNRCLNNGKPYESSRKAGDAINRLGQRISDHVKENHKLFINNHFDWALSTLLSKDENGNLVDGSVYIPIYKDDFENLLLKNKVEED